MFFLMIHNFFKPPRAFLALNGLKCYLLALVACFGAQRALKGYRGGLTITQRRWVLWI